jgi:hypothetical protein
VLRIFQVAIRSHRADFAKTKRPVLSPAMLCFHRRSTRSWPDPFCLTHSPARASERAQGLEDPIWRGCSGQDIGPSGRGVHRMTYDSNRQRVVLFGGEQARPLCSRFKDKWEWDGEYWKQMNDLGPLARSAHTLVFDSIRQRTVCFGGLSNISDSSSAFGDTWEMGWTGLDADGRHWSCSPFLPTHKP